MSSHSIVRNRTGLSANKLICHANIHFRDPYTTGHKYGGKSPEKIQTLKDCDAAITTIRDAVRTAGFLDDSIFILTADHDSRNVKDKNGKISGTHRTAETIDVEIPWVACGKGVKKNFTIDSIAVQYDTAPTALCLLGITGWSPPRMRTIPHPPSAANWRGSRRRSGVEIRL
ncbi:MAG: alkaline phosphatase [Verrucomicrobiota bacterium]